MLGQYWAPKSRSRKSLDESAGDHGDDDGNEEGEEYPQTEGEVVETDGNGDSGNQEEHQPQNSESQHDPEHSNEKDLEELLDNEVEGRKDSRDQLRKQQDCGNQNPQQPSSPLAASASQSFQPVRTPRKGKGKEDVEEMDPYMAWTLGGDLPATLELKSPWPTSPWPVRPEPSKWGSGNDDAEPDSVEDIDAKLRQLEFLECIHQQYTG